MSGLSPPEGDPVLVERIAADAVPYWVSLGIRVDRAVAPGHVYLRLPMREGLGTRRPEIMHGGAIASLIDAAAGGAIISQFGGDADYRGQATLDLNVTFLNAATGDVVAEGLILRSSRTIAFTQVHVRNGDGALVATGRATFTILRKG
ncbi:MAG: PaaI family thioesterase [Dehalococcoidia bacterium]|nr:PaaI family thioesterase [Dehalococcoidia bacterium]